MKRFAFAVILLGLVCLSSALIDVKEDDSQLQERVQELPKRLTRTKVRWMDEYERPSRWLMRRRWGGEKKKARKNKLTKRLKRKQRRRMRVIGRGDDFRLADHEIDQLDDFIPAQGQLYQEDEMMDAQPQPIRIRIRLNRRGPVKRAAKKSKRKLKKKSKKQKKKALVELAEKEAMTKVLKDFLNSRRRRGRHGRKRSKKIRLIGKDFKRRHPKVSRRPKLPKQQ